MSENWPAAELDDVRRLRVIAAAARNTTTMYAEGVVPASFEDVWAVASDLENELPRLLPDVRTLTIRWRDGEHLGADARGRLGLRARLDVVLRPGWCLMRSRFLLGGMAAVAEADGTRFAFLGGLRVPGARLAHPVLHRIADPLAGSVVARMAARATAR